MELSLWEVAVFNLLGVDRSHGVIWNWTHTLTEVKSDPQTVEPSRVAVDGKSGCTPPSTPSQSIGNRRVQPPQIGPVAAFLHRLTDKHNVSDAAFLVNPTGYLLSSPIAR